LCLCVPLVFILDMWFHVGIMKMGGLLISAKIDNATYDSLKISDKVWLRIIELEDEKVFYTFKTNEIRLLD